MGQSMNPLSGAELIGIPRKHQGPGDITKPGPGSQDFCKIGATVRSRTADILITSEVLYQLSYGGLATFQSLICVHP